MTPDGSLLRRGQAATKGASAISARDGYLWVVIRKHKQVVQLDAHTGRKLGFIASAADPRAIALSPGSVYVFQGDRTGTWVQRYDASTHSAEPPKIPVDGGTKRLSVRDGTLWVLVQDSGDGPDHIARYDAKTGTPVQPSVDVAAPVPEQCAA